MDDPIIEIRDVNLGTIVRMYLQTKFIIDAVDAVDAIDAIDAIDATDGVG